MKVLVAMSGGVDSSVAAALMLEAGHDVVGVTLKQWEEADGSLPTAGCCTVGDAEDARRVASMLDIPYYVLDYVDAFRERVVDEFGRAYMEAERRTRASSAIGGSGSEPCWSASHSSDAMRWPPGITLASPNATVALSCCAVSTPQKTSRTCCTCSARRSWHRSAAAHRRTLQDRGSGARRPPRAAYGGETGQPGPVLRWGRLPRLSQNALPGGGASWTRCRSRRHHRWGA
jgi:hypothetical protein